ncbi:hypothetical protein [Nonomuraea turcica]|uniref:hypothetical protein n=1 Tax=Nonomuraea sp. G32 TaxID=3067274 RepID=UPI00273CA291|nr:hypothetical protein [Nonomuraea sp. G32]MDP4507123.1 hypothetical protein [Nonomuraea sp. G32]
MASIGGPGTTPLYVQVDTVRRPREASAGRATSAIPRGRAAAAVPADPVTAPMAANAQPAAHRDAYVKHPY